MGAVAICGQYAQIGGQCQGISIWRTIITDVTAIIIIIVKLCLVYSFHVFKWGGGSEFEKGYYYHFSYHITCIFI